MDSLEMRLCNIAKRIADLYRDRLSTSHYQQLCAAIKVCVDYYMEELSKWIVMYQAILNENGISDYANYPELYEFEKDVQDMWLLETYILICNCYLGCTKEQDYIPEDMELQGKKIPMFVEFLEKNVNDKIDCESICSFFEKNICF